MLVVLDNAESFAQIWPLLPGSGTCTVLITSRNQLGEMLGRQGALRLRLDALSLEESVELVSVSASRQHAAHEPAMARIAGFCDGLPLALRLCGARLAAKPHWSPDHLVLLLADDQRRLDELSCCSGGVQASLEPSYRRLSPAAATLYRRLGLLDLPEFTTSIGAHVHHNALTETAILLEELVDAHLLEASLSDEGTPLYHFRSLFRCHARVQVKLEQRLEDEAATGGLNLDEIYYHQNRLLPVLALDG